MSIDPSTADLVLACLVAVLGYLERRSLRRQRDLELIARHAQRAAGTTRRAGDRG